MELLKQHDTKTGAESIPLARDYLRIRALTQDLAECLHPEDTVPQSMPDASPTKWHLAHTAWFFDQFVLTPHAKHWHPENRWALLFNSYYQAVGPQFARAERGLLTRPTLTEVMKYRALVDQSLLILLARDCSAAVCDLVRLGLEHEQQHQELLLTDIKHLFSLNPLEPAYCTTPPNSASTPASGLETADNVALHFIEGQQGIVDIGHTGSEFAYDNEGPRHQVLLQPHAIANRPVNNGEFREFIRDGGYCEPRLWLADGWNMVQRNAWQRPLYWDEDMASEFTLRGREPLDPQAPVCHISFFEADAYARWADARLPTEAEWETLAATRASQRDAVFLDSAVLHPQRPRLESHGGPLQMFGDVWEWTSSPYVNYPGFRPLSGALGEYNGKFMCGQWVLRGGSCATPAGHIRATYRNFFYPAARWQFSGLRLAKDS